MKIFNFRFSIADFRDAERVRRAAGLSCPCAISIVALLVLVAAAAQQSEIGNLKSEITGRVAPNLSVTSVVAVDRSSNKRIMGKIEPDSGKFHIENVKVSTSYDLIIDFKPAADSGLSLWRLEGVNMKVPRSDYEEEQPLAAEDVKTIKEKILSLNQFEDVVEILAIDGNIQHAAILVNKLRTKPFYESKPGEIIWRPELWHFERPDETWVKVQDELFVTLYRERIQQSEFAKRSVTFDSALGGLQLTDDANQLDLGTVKLPDAKPGVRFRGVDAQAKTSVNPDEIKKPAGVRN